MIALLLAAYFDDNADHDDANQNDDNHDEDDYNHNGPSKGSSAHIMITLMLTTYERRRIYIQASYKK